MMETGQTVSKEDDQIKEARDPGMCLIMPNGIGLTNVDTLLWLQQLILMLLFLV